MFPFSPFLGPTNGIGFPQQDFFPFDPFFPMMHPGMFPPGMEFEPIQNCAPQWPAQFPQHQPASQKQPMQRNNTSPQQTGNRKIPHHLHGTRLSQHLQPHNFEESYYFPEPTELHALTNQQDRPRRELNAFQMTGASPSLRARPIVGPEISVSRDRQGNPTAVNIKVDGVIIPIRLNNADDVHMHDSIQTAVPPQQESHGRDQKEEKPKQHTLHYTFRPNDHQHEVIRPQEQFVPPQGIFFPPPHMLGIPCQPLFTMEEIFMPEPFQYF